LKTFPKDFYGDRLSVAVTGFLRNELNFTSLQGLIDAINTDICLARQFLSAGGDFAEPAAKADTSTAAP
jgi:FAD synthase